MGLGSRSSRSIAAQRARYPFTKEYGLKKCIYLYVYNGPSYFVGYIPMGIGLSGRRIDGSNGSGRSWSSQRRSMSSSIAGIALRFSSCRHFKGIVGIM